MSRTSVRLPDDLEAAAREKCKRLDLNLSQVMRRLLREWLAKTETVQEQEADDDSNREPHQ